MANAYDDALAGMPNVEAEIFASVYWAILYNRGLGTNNVAADALNRFIARLNARTQLKSLNNPQKNNITTRVQTSLTANAGLDDVVVAQAVAADGYAQLLAAGLVL